jgi:EpsI family protein
MTPDMNDSYAMAVSDGQTSEYPRGAFGFRLLTPWAVVISFLILGSLLWFSHTLAKEPPALRRESLGTFPKQLGDFHLLQDITLDQVTLDALKPTDVLMRYYQRRPEEPPVSLYIPFFQTQQEDSRIHNPAACLPGAGWQFVERTLQPLPWRGKTAYANRVVLQKGLDWQMGLYWIHSNGRVVPGEYMAKLYLLWDVFTKRRSDGALVRLMTVMPRSPDLEEDEAAAQERLVAAAKATLAVLPHFLPN